MREPRVAGAAAVADDRIVVVGGQANDQLVPGTEVFDGKSWKPAADIPTPREHLAAASDGHYVYAIGGRDLDAGKNIAALERYDPATDRGSGCRTCRRRSAAWARRTSRARSWRSAARRRPTSSTRRSCTTSPRAAGALAPRSARLATGWPSSAPGDTVYALDGARAAGHTRSTRWARHSSSRAGESDARLPGGPPRRLAGRAPGAHRRRPPRRALPAAPRRRGRAADRGACRRADRLTLGRAPGCELELGWDAKVSGTHAQLERIGGSDWTLVDDGLSRNGSFVNSERLRGRRRLADGDVLRFGDTTSCSGRPCARWSRRSR